MAWLIVSDGTITESEKSFFQTAFPNYRQILDRFVGNVRLPDTDLLRSASLTILHVLPAERKQELFEMLCNLVVVDGRISISEIHILRFVADLLGLGRQQVNLKFERVTGHPLGDPGDLSSARWWQERVGNNRKTSGEEEFKQDQDSRKKDRATPQTDRIDWACSVLGIERGAPQYEIKAAYREKSKLYHPDRFSALGSEAVVAANAIFARFNEAYEVLKER